MMFRCKQCGIEMFQNRNILYCVNSICDFYGILSLAYVEEPGQEPRLLENQR